MQCEYTMQGYIHIVAVIYYTMYPVILVLYEGTRLISIYITMVLLEKMTYLKNQAVSLRLPLTE